MKTIALTTASLRNLENMPLPRDFTFEFEDAVYHTFKIIACVLSPKISLLMKNDTTYDRFKFQLSDPKHRFKTVLDLAFSHTDITIDKSNFLFIRHIGKILENSQLISLATNDTFYEPEIENALLVLNDMYE